jgi:hypothetical protein
MEKLMIDENKISKHRDLVFGNQNYINLVAPCKIGDGVLNFLKVQQENLISKFDQSTAKSTFFIPASGSGSRMYQFLHEFVTDPTDENLSQMERFLNNIEDFAFYQLLPSEVKRKLKSHDFNLDEFVQFLLSNSGMSFAEISKGMVPFHKSGPFVLNPFQEHILQGKRVNEERISFHFTIRDADRNAISESIKHAEFMSGNQTDISFSCQNELTDSYAFDAQKNVVLTETGEPLTRPAGHGALLENLNAIESDLIFIKNIDNIQHYSKSDASTQTWKFLGGIALWLHDEIKNIIQDPSLESLIELNKNFQLYHSDEITNLSNEEIKDLLNRPLRVCGMVRNEGQQGGGPFWVKDGAKISKQIVEKVQISSTSDQFRLMAQSSHFNPVMIAAITKDFSNQKFDLQKFKNPTNFFIVKKKHQGKDILFSELPGLWNGSMANWNTVFVEIPSSTFSPVKTVLDLLEDDHKDTF